jgi:4-hydroxybenzoate polyprenyltransferase
LKVNTKISAFISLIRPKTLVWFCIATCFGFASIIQGEIPNTDFIFLVLTIVFANIGAIIVNDIGDIKVDKLSPEQAKRSRPLVTGEISITEAKMLAAIFFTLSLITSLAYDIRATIFSVVVILFSLSYSLPPTKFCARPYGSILYWVFLCLSCYLLMLNALSTSEKTISFYFDYTPGWIFIGGIILYMGIAEIIAKDLRDMVNDKEGGRNTFVNFVGAETSSRAMIFFAWLGFILWIEALYLAELSLLQLVGHYVL